MRSITLRFLTGIFLSLALQPPAFSGGSSSFILDANNKSHILDMFQIINQKVLSFLKKTYPEQAWNVMTLLKTMSELPVVLKQELLFSIATEIYGLSPSASIAQKNENLDKLNKFFWWNLWTTKMHLQDVKAIRKEPNIKQIQEVLSILSLSTLNSQTYSSVQALKNKLSSNTLSDPALEYSLGINQLFFDSLKQLFSPSENNLNVDTDSSILFNPRNISFEQGENNDDTPEKIKTQISVENQKKETDLLFQDGNKSFSILEFFHSLNQETFSFLNNNVFEKKLGVKAFESKTKWVMMLPDYAETKKALYQHLVQKFMPSYDSDQKTKNFLFQNFLYRLHIIDEPKNLAPLYIKIVRLFKEQPHCSLGFFEKNFPALHQKRPDLVTFLWRSNGILSQSFQSEALAKESLNNQLPVTFKTKEKNLIQPFRILHHSEVNEENKQLQGCLKNVENPRQKKKLSVHFEETYLSPEDHESQEQDLQIEKLQAENADSVGLAEEPKKGRGFRIKKSQKTNSDKEMEKEIDARTDEQFSKSQIIFGMTQVALQELKKNFPSESFTAEDLQNNFQRLDLEKFVQLIKNQPWFGNVRRGSAVLKDWKKVHLIFDSLYPHEKAHQNFDNIKNMIKKDRSLKKRQDLDAFKTPLCKNPTLINKISSELMITPYITQRYLKNIEEENVRFKKVVESCFSQIKKSKELPAKIIQGFSSFDEKFKSMLRFARLYFDEIEKIDNKEIRIEGMISQNSLENEAVVYAEEGAEGRQRRETRGRKKGIRNKVKMSSQEMMSENEEERAEGSQRRETRGRKKGIRNKVKMSSQEMLSENEGVVSQNSQNNLESGGMINEEQGNEGSQRVETRRMKKARIISKLPSQEMLSENEELQTQSNLKSGKMSCERRYSKGKQSVEARGRKKMPSQQMLSENEGIGSENQLESMELIYEHEGSQRVETRDLKQGIRNNSKRQSEERFFANEELTSYNNWEHNIKVIEEDGDKVNARSSQHLPPSSTEARFKKMNLEEKPISFMQANVQANGRDPIHMNIFSQSNPTHHQPIHMNVFSQFNQSERKNLPNLSFHMQNSPYSSIKQEQEGSSERWRIYQVGELLFKQLQSKVYSVPFYPDMLRSTENIFAQIQKKIDPSMCRKEYVSDLIYECASDDLDELGKKLNQLQEQNKPWYLFFTKLLNENYTEKHIARWSVQVYYFVFAESSKKSNEEFLTYSEAQKKFARSQTEIMNENRKFIQLSFNGWEKQHEFGSYLKRNAINQNAQILHKRSAAEAPYKSSESSVEDEAQEKIEVEMLRSLFQESLTYVKSCFPQEKTETSNLAERIKSLSQSQKQQVYGRLDNLLSKHESHLAWPKMRFIFSFWFKQYGFDLNEKWQNIDNDFHLKYAEQMRSVKEKTFRKTFRVIQNIQQCEKPQENIEENFFSVLSLNVNSNQNRERYQEKTPTKNFRESIVNQGVEADEDSMFSIVDESNESELSLEKNEGSILLTAPNIQKHQTSSSLEASFRQRK
jgi:hypothetical protein